MRLLIGNKTYSTWSLRPWLLLRHAGIPFEEEPLSFNDPDFTARVKRHSPVGKVPVLIDGEIVVWDSLAIAEYLAESFPAKRLWPAERAARAHARALCAELHAGFREMRAAMPMNCTARFENVLFPIAVQRDVARAVEIFVACRTKAAEGPFLFGAFSIADAFYAPITRRFRTYGVALPAVAEAYVEAIEQLPAMQEWLAAARLERDFVVEDEPYRERP